MKYNNHYCTNNANDNSGGKRREHERRDMDVCMVNVEGHPYPVTDWSQGGVLFETDTRAYEIGQTITMILRFKIGNSVEDVKVIGEIVRKNAKAVAAQFKDVHDTALASFARVIAQAS